LNLDQIAWFKAGSALDVIKEWVAARPSSPYENDQVRRAFGQE